MEFTVLFQSLIGKVRPFEVLECRNNNSRLKVSISHR